MASGTCGDNATWNLNESTGVLTISGTGAIKDYSLFNLPFSDYEDVITSIIIEDGITHIGAYLCWRCEVATSLIIGKTVVSIGEWAFRSCENLGSITFLTPSAPTMGDNSFELGVSSFSETSTTIYTYGWGSDSIFNSDVIGSYTTVTYVVIKTSPEIPVNVSGTWKNATPYVNVNGTWKEVKAVYVNVNGTWKETV